MPRPLLRLLPAALLALAMLAPGEASAPAQAEQQPLQITTDITYEIHPEAGPVHVTWQVNLLNNDPRTVNRPAGTISFYDSLTLPLLRGATDIVARSEENTELTVTLDPSGQGPLVTAKVSFDRRLFYRDSYAFSLEYDLPAAREDSLLVTPYYVFLPAVALGDRALVSITTPSDPAWEVALEPVDCPQEANTFTCQGSPSLYLAALAEVSRPDATTNVPLEIQLQETEVSLTLTYFQGEEGWAQHLLALLPQALPVMEEVYGFPYPGPSTVTLAERGRQVILGYEGVTSCGANSCEIAISPVADDLTVLHELAHLWSDIYRRRWLSEGFAEFVALRTAQRLGPGLVQAEPPRRDPFALDLRLDEWGEVTFLITATEEERAREDAGYARSLYFMELLERTVGLDALRQANATLHQSQEGVDSRRFMDALEEASGQNLDELFLTWVFPDSFAPVIQQRREARDRLAKLAARAEAEGLSTTPIEEIRQQVEDWRFDQALAALDRAEGSLQTYLQIKERLSALRQGAEAAGLEFPRTLQESLEEWDFSSVSLSLDDAEAALAAYIRAREKVEEPRPFWRRVGLWGSDPEHSLEEAARAFGQGDFQTALEKAKQAEDAIDDAAFTALLRLLIALGVVAIVASVVVTGYIYWHRR